jgi:hypothetical protein
MSTARLLFWLAVDPQALVKASVDQAIRAQPSPPDANREAELRAAFTAQFTDAVGLIRRVLRRSFLVVFGAITAAIITGRALAWLRVPSSASIDQGLQYAGLPIHFPQPSDGAR